MFWVATFYLGLVSSGALALQIRLPPEINLPNPEEVPGLFQGDIILDGVDPYNAIGNLKRRWPSTNIPISIHSYFDKYDKAVFHESMREIEDQTRVDNEDCIKFVNWTTEKAYIYITTGYGCQSQVGFTGKAQPLTLGALCRFKGTVIHEMLHSLGFFHEQNRPDRDDYIKIINENIKKGHERNFMKLFPPDINTQGLPYDYNSLTHYGPTTFSVDHIKPTIIPLKEGVTIGQRQGMSQLDIVQLQRLYKCKERKLIKPQTPGMVTPNCTFDSDLCGWTLIDILPPLKNNTWTRWSGETVNYHSGPVTDHTFNTFEGFYIYVNAFKNYNSVAKIQSPEIAPGDYCLSFWYHMHGRDMGSLFVNLVKNGMAWKLRGLKGDQGNKWKQMKVFVQAPNGGKIEFEGIAGNMYRSDTAVDDVLLTPGSC
uniref:Metalloendopeptidase n=1 Tax=Heterololigo bleekeri TaxID=1423826 RepID=Q8IU44_HETBL|nr:myosinase-III [Heterololigo bleekeri]